MRYRDIFHKTLVILLILLFSGTLNFSASEFDLNYEEETWLDAHPVIYYAPDPTFAPMEYIDDNGDVKGIAIDYLNWVGENYGIQFEYVKFKNWTGVLDAVEDKEIDMVSASKTPARQKYLNFSDVYLSLGNTILVREDFTGNLSEKDLLNVKTGIMNDYAVADYLELKYPEIDLVKYDSVEDALKQLSFGSIDALVLDIAQGSHYITDFGISNLRSAGDIDYYYSLCFAARDDYDILVGIMNKAIASMPDEDYLKIKSKWIASASASTIDSKIIWIGTGILIFTFLVIGAFLLWNRLLRREVALQTEKLQNELKLRMSIQEELLAKNHQITQMNNELELTERELSSLIDLVPYHIFAKDDTGRFVLVNTAFLEFFNFTKDQVIGKTDQELFTNLEPELIEKINAGNDILFKKREPIVIEELEMPDHSNALHVLWIKKIPYFIWKRNKWGILVVTIDITNLKHAESKLEDLNGRLEAKVERRAYLLNETNRELELSMYKLQMKQNQLEESNNLLEESLESLRETQNQLIESEKLAALGRLVAGVSHEINTPLGIGITSISFLERECNEMVDIFSNNGLTKAHLEEFLENMQDTTKLILANLKNAAGLVNKFKQIAVDQSTEEIREFNLYEYLDGIIQSLSPQLKHTSHSFELVCPKDITILSYPSILTQIITNLVMNSLVHGFEDQENGHIKLLVEEEDTTTLVFHYTDNGKGIAPDHIEKVFEPFFTTKRGKGGVGLGLNIVYNLITRTLGGKIEVKSTENNGVHFIIHVPIPEFSDASFHAHEDSVYN